MIENIYGNVSNDNIEKNTPVLFKMPKNIRQIGQGGGEKKIYVEDYVMTYVKQLSGKTNQNNCFAILLGKFLKIDNCRNIFIHGAVGLGDINLEESKILPNEAWTSIYEDIKEYFTDVEIVGWCIARAGLSLVPDDNIRKIHGDNFGGQDKVLLLYECFEREEAFYIFESSGLKRQSGYYIYYEKNEEMQNYLVDHKSGVSEETNYEDRTIKEIRRVIETKKVPETSSKMQLKLLYGAGTMVAVVVLVFGTALLTNYDKMKGMEQALEVISNTLLRKSNLESNALNENTTDLENIDGEETTEVETMVGNITTIKNEEVEGEKDLNQQDDTKEKSPDSKKNETNVDKKSEEEETKKSKEQSDVPKKTKPTEAPVKEEVSKEKYYVVKKGDTLASISIEVFHTIGKVQEIQEKNKIENQDKIIIGQKLLLPE